MVGAALDRWARAIVLLGIVSLSPAGAPATVPPSRDQQACIDQVNRRARGLLKAHGAELKRCLKGAAKGRVPDAQACLAGDERGRLERARKKLEQSFAHRTCVPEVPPFGLTQPSAVQDAAALAGPGLASDLYGQDLGPAISPRGSDEARCQAAVTKRTLRVGDQVVGSWVRATRESLRGGKTTVPVLDGVALASAIEVALEADARGALAKASGMLRASTERHCEGLDLAALFPGTCAAAAATPELASCLDAATRCRSCEAIEAIAALDLDCDLLDDAVRNETCGEPAEPMGPSLIASVPSEGESAVEPHAWLSLDYDGPLPAGARDNVELRCGGSVQRVRIDAPSPGRVLVKPDLMLEADSDCTLAHPVPGGVAALAFSTGPETPHVVVDRTHPEITVPFPDDYHLAPDPNAPSGRRIALEVPDYEGLRLGIGQGIARALSRWDGFSPIAPIVLVLSHPLDPASVPQGVETSLAPGASVLLLDSDPNSPSYGARVPFDLVQRSDRARDGTRDHTVIVFPAVSLRAGGRYDLVVRSGARDASGRALVRSAFYASVAAGAVPGEEPELARARASIEQTLQFVEGVVQPGIPRTEVTASARLSVRSAFGDPSDRVSVKEQALAEAPAVPSIDSTHVIGGDVVVRGTLPLPFYLLGPGFGEVSRDPETGAPIAASVDEVPFVLRYAQAAAQPLPVVIYQHGSPGSPEEIGFSFNDFLVDAGYALIGIQDVANRSFGASVAEQLEFNLTWLVIVGTLPLSNFQTNADQIGLLRAIQGMGVSGNSPELDPTRILYRGISFGSHHALGFLPFAPEIRAAASVVGAGRLYHQNLHQLDLDDGFGPLIENVLAAVPDARPREVVVAFAQLQHEADRDDGHLMARHLYREPLAFAGLSGGTPPSLLWIEGIGDSWIQNTATRAAAVELGVPTLRPVAEGSPVLTEVDAPLSQNIAAGVAAAHFQYDPATTQSCIDAFESEGHFCPQIATEAEVQTIHLFSTALSGAPEIIDPFD